MLQKDVDNLPIGKLLWDKGQKDSVKGLHLRAFREKKVFYLYYRTKTGLQRRPKIGEYRILSIKQARDIAREMLVRVASGEDPSLSRKKIKGELTIFQLFRETWKEHWSDARYERSGHASEVHRNYRKNIAPFFGSRKLSELTAAEIRRWHAGFRENPYAGNRSLEVLSRMFNFAEEMEWRPQNTNPCILVSAHKEQKRNRFANEREISSIGKILERESDTHPAAVAFIYLLIFSGSRPRAIERAKWEDINRCEIEGQAFGILTLDGKTGRDTIYIPPQAMCVIDTLPRVDGGTITGIKMPRALWAKIRKETGCQDLWARDWRRTFATTGMGLGFEMAVISELLNHKSAQTTMRYAKLNDESRKEVATKTASKIDALLRA
jgi:integrase